MSHVRLLQRVIAVAIVAAAGGIAGAGCDADDEVGEAELPLTCELLSDPGNCWATAAAAAAACFVDEEIGVLAADRTHCTFSGGVRVVFDSPLPQQIEDLERLAFDIEVDGEPCARFVDTFENRMELTAGGVTVVSQLRGDFELICGDGTTYSTDFGNLFDCEPGTQPTDGFDVTPEMMFFSVWSVSTPGELFRCEAPVQ